jgi:hypothetical protein
LTSAVRGGYADRVRGCPPSRAVDGRSIGPLRVRRYLRSRPAPLAVIPSAVPDSGHLTSPAGIGLLPVSGGAGGRTQVSARGPALTLPLGQVRTHRPLPHIECDAAALTNGRPPDMCRTAAPPCYEPHYSQPWRNVKSAVGGRWGRAVWAGVACRDADRRRGVGATFGGVQASLCWEIGMAKKRRWPAITGQGVVLVTMATLATLIAAELTARRVYNSQARQREATTGSSA